MEKTTNDIGHDLAVLSAGNEITIIGDDENYVLTTDADAKTVGLFSMDFAYGLDSADMTEKGLTDLYRRQGLIT